MFARSFSIIFSFISLSLCFIFSNASEECDRKSCLGPLYYYEEIGCTPIFENATSCCPTRYNCDVWKNLPADKCFVDGRVFEVNEVLPARYASDPCYNCRCIGNFFVCSLPSCVSPLYRNPNCQYRFSSLECCKFYEICENSPVACIVDGKSYKIGETFHPAAEPDKTCYCKKGYNGVNDERFCVWRKPSWCQNVIRHIQEIRNNCPPVYAEDAAIYKDCNEGHICPEAGSYEIEKEANNNEKEPGSVESKDSTHQCKYGNSTMNIGDKLRGERRWGGPVSCICQVPPIPTCYEIKPPEDETA